MQERENKGLLRSPITYEILVYLFFSTFRWCSFILWGILKKNKGKPQLIINIFSKEYKGQTQWDLSCGLERKVPIQTRKKEDKKAIRLVGTASIYLIFFDNLVFKDLKNSERLFSDSRKIKSEVAKILMRNISSLKGVFFPLGISHPDHFLIAKIGKDKAKELSQKGIKVYFYEDFPSSLHF